MGFLSILVNKYCKCLFPPKLKFETRKHKILPVRRERHMSKPSILFFFFKKIWLDIVFLTTRTLNLYAPTTSIFEYLFNIIRIGWNITNIFV